MQYNYRGDFRKGRVGRALEGKQSAEAYSSGVHDALNCMVMADGSLRRRWGSFDRGVMLAPARLEAWVYADSPGFRFLLAFTDGGLRVYDDDLSTVANFTGMPWDSTTMWIMSLAFLSDQLLVTNLSFQPVVFKLDVAGGTISQETFDFEKKDDGVSLGAPFYAFPDGKIDWTLTNYMPANEGTAVADTIAAALGITGGTYNATAGTGTMTTASAYFTSDFVGMHLKLLDGEVKVTAVNSSTSAEIEVIRPVVKKLVDDPFWLRSISSAVRVSVQDHGLQKGDIVFFFDLSRYLQDNAQRLLANAGLVAQNPSDAPTTFSGGAVAPYTVMSVIDKDTFEVTGDRLADDNWVGLYGGGDVKMIPVSRRNGIKEPVFSDYRGWPNCACYHENRLWMGGSYSLASSVFGSRINQYQRFDEGEGEPGDGVLLYSVGGKARVKHIVSDFDLLVFTDDGEFYVPGSTEKAITPETARAIAATTYGSYHVTPQKFDGSIFFVDKVQAHLREFSAETRDTDYTAPPATVVVPDWVNVPGHSCVYPGATVDNMPYMIVTNHGDGSALVCHSARENDSFGFMRWTVDGGAFVSFAALGTRLFALVDLNGINWRLVEFDSDLSPGLTTDIASYHTGSGMTSVSDFPVFGNTAKAVLDGVTNVDLTFSLGVAQLPEPADAVEVGVGMPGFVELNGAVAVTRQGPLIGKDLCIASVEILWRDTRTGLVDEEDVTPVGDSLFAPANLDEWETYWPSIWGKEPRLRISFEEPGNFGIASYVLNVRE